MHNEAPKGNIGEWSELYTLGYLLVNGGAFAADENQEEIPELFHKVLQVHFQANKNSPEINYKIERNEVGILVTGQKVAQIEKSLIESSLKLMLDELRSGDFKRTFSLTSGEKLLELLNKNRISAGSNEHENDLELTLEDPATKAPTPRVGFNIKSQLGGRSTLLNASGATNFIYKVVKNEATIHDSYPIFQHGKHRQNLTALYDKGFHLEFKALANDIFYQNLTLLDMQFPNYLANALLNSYLTGEDSFENVVNAVFPSSIDASRQPIFKLKEFLGAVAMGLRPSSQWDGDTTKFSGILVVKGDGKVVFYYLYNRKNFEEHLFRSVAFERASTSRHKYGEIYSESGEDLIKLNLQIRFTS